ncbi:MAG: hypothetical protein AAFQ43_13795 [Bacteroidota bacterium]
MLLWTVLGLLVAAKLLNWADDWKAQGRIRANALRREDDTPEAS